MKKHLLIPPLLVVLTCGAQAASVAINFQRGSNGNRLMDSTDVAGVAPVAQMNWNNVTQAAALTGTIADLNEDSGSSSGISVAWAGDASFSTNNGTSNGHNKMMGGYLDDTAGGLDGATVTFTGITYAAYDVYVYFGTDGANRRGTVTDGTTTYSYTGNSQTGGNFPAAYAQTTDTGTGSPAANYAIFSGLSADTLIITNRRGNDNTGIHGIQVVAVPEPGSMSLLLAGACSALFRRRRR